MTFRAFIRIGTGAVLLIGALCVGNRIRWSNEGTLVPSAAPSKGQPFQPKRYDLTQNGTVGDELHSRASQIRVHSFDPVRERLSAMIKRIQAEMDSFRSEQQFAELQAFADSVEHADLPSTIRLLAQIQENAPTQAGRDLQSRLVRRWMEHDLNSALEWVNQWPAGEIRTESINVAMTIWARANVDTAAAWAGQLSNIEEQNSALLAIAQEIVHLKPSEALSIAAALPVTQSRDELISRAVEEWSATDAASSIAWIRQVPAGTLGEGSLTALAVSLADQAPASAADLAAALLPAGPKQESAVIGIIQRWAQQDFDAASAWVNLFPEGSLREAAAANLNRIAQIRQQRSNAF